MDDENHSTALNNQTVLCAVKQTKKMVGQPVNGQNNTGIKDKAISGDI